MNSFFLFYKAGVCTDCSCSCELVGFATLAEAEQARDDFLKARGWDDPEVVIIEGAVIYERVQGS